MNNSLKENFEKDGFFVLRNLLNTDDIKKYLTSIEKNYKP